MRTPGHDADLAAGFLLTEGIIHRREDVLSVKHCAHNREHNVLNVLLARDVSVDFQQLTRHVFASSSCGLCGKATIQSIHGQFPPVRSRMIVDARLLTTLTTTMRAAQENFDRTGGLHAAALFDVEGKMIVLREDVGRHNAVDKLVGHCLLNGIFPLDQHILVVSGRSSFEIMQKARSGEGTGRCSRVSPVEPRGGIRGGKRADTDRIPQRGSDERLFQHPSHRVHTCRRGANLSRPIPLNALRIAVREGFRDRVDLETEPDLESIRNLDDFKTILGEIRPG